MIIPIFLMNRGCPHRCLFCNERLTAGGRPAALEPEAFARTVRIHLAGARRKAGPVQIAFYGGTFTGMAEGEQRRLLEMAAPFLAEGAVDSLRISTRPDEIDAAGIEMLRAFGVATVEVGAQSFDDDVLVASGRGHRAAQSVSALKLLRERGFETGVHLMAGLPGEGPGSFLRTIERVIAIRPDTVRIHPTLVLRDTPLAEAFQEGGYLPLTLEAAVDGCREALKRLTAAGIPVIRLGLQTTRELEEPGAVVAGPFHPAFRSLVASSLCLEMAAALLEAAHAGKGDILFTLPPADLADFLGPGRRNLAVLEERFGVHAIPFAVDPALPRGTLGLRTGRRAFSTDCSGRITLLDPDPPASRGLRRPGPASKAGFASN